MALTRRWIAVGLLASAIAAFMCALAQIPAASIAASQPFKMAERTEYGITENNVYLTFTDTSDKAQYITNITFVFADSAKTRQITVSDFLLEHSYPKNVYGYINTSLGKYSKIETNCTTANATQICEDYYADSLGKKMECDYVLADKSCLKKIYGVVGTVTAYDYMPIPNTKQKTITNGLKIEQKVEGSVPLAKGGSAEIKITMPHLLFYGITVADWENKYNITACSQYGCSELDPAWWNATWNKTRPDSYNSSLASAMVNDFPYLLNGTNYVDTSNTGLDLTSTCAELRIINGSQDTALAWEAANATNNTYGCGQTKTEIWARNNISAGVTTNSSHVYYGNTTPVASGENTHGVWDSNFLAVYHGGEGEGLTMHDSTGHYNATMSDGHVWGNGETLFGTAPYYNALYSAETGSDLSNGASAFTIEAWIKSDDAPAGREDIVGNEAGNGGGSVKYYNNAPYYLKAEYYISGGWISAQTQYPPAGVWNYVVMTFNGTHIALYVNGTLAATGARSGTISAGTTYKISPSSGNMIRFDGAIDEVRISDVARSGDYINAMWEQRLKTFSALGIEETRSSGASIIITAVAPTNTTYNYTNIKINGSTNIDGNVTYSVDGGGNLTACLTCTEFENFTVLTYGTHNIHIYAVNSEDESQVDDEIIYFTIDTEPPYITIVNPSGTYAQNDTINLNYTAGDTYSTVSKCWYSLNNASNVSLTSCANTTLTITQAGTHNISVFANDTVNNINGTSTAFTYDPFENFTANDTLDGSQIDEFQVLIIETAGSYSTTNGTIPVPLSAIGYGSRTIRFISTGYGTTDFARTFGNDTLQTENYTLMPASLNITVYDEVQASIDMWVNLTFNITITNSTSAVTWYNQSVFFKRINETPTGFITADISSYGYQPRRYYLISTPNTANYFTGYLLPIADSLFVRFHIHNTAGSSISGASVNASRFINDSWAIVSQQTSDESGIAAMYLNPFATYIIAAGKTGFTATSITIQPSATDYVITLQSGSAAEPFETATTNVTAVFTPTTASINASLITFMCQVNSSDNSLQYVSFNVTHYNGTVWYTNVSAVTSNITLSASVNLTAENGTNLTALCSFKRTGFDWVLLNRTYYVYNITGGYFEQAAAAARAQYSKMTLGLISIIITAIAAGGIGSIGKNTLAGAFAGLIVLGIFTFMLGWFDWQVYILICMVFGAIMYLRSGV